jgi:ABC-type multidrug transport system fused ATPase/permease subunit
LQASGVRLGMLFQSLASIGAGIIIAFVFSWKLALFILALMPFFLVGALLEMKGMKGFAVSNKKALEHAGQVTSHMNVCSRKLSCKRFHDTLKYMSMLKMPH